MFNFLSPKPLCAASRQGVPLRLLHVASPLPEFSSLPATSGALRPSVSGVAPLSAFVPQLAGSWVFPAPSAMRARRLSSASTLARLLLSAVLPVIAAFEPSWPLLPEVASWPALLFLRPLLHSSASPPLQLCASLPFEYEVSTRLPTWPSTLIVHVLFLLSPVYCITLRYPLAFLLHLDFK